MAKSTLRHEIAGFLVPQNTQNGYLNATALAKAYESCSGKRRDVRDWLQNKRTNETLKHLGTSTGIPVDQLVIINSRGRNEYRGTYIHPRLAVRFAIWLSDEFGLWVEELVNDWMVNGAGNPLWHVDRQKIKDSNELLRDAIASYVQRHEDELSENRKRYIYNNVNDKLAIALVGCRPAKFRSDMKANCFRDALNKNQLEQLEQLEKLATRLIEKKDMSPLEAVENAALRLMINV